MSTLGQRMSRADRRALEEQVAAANYSRGCLFAPLAYKADDDDAGFLKPVTFKGFANTGRPDLGDDIVEPEAFSKATLAEFLKFGRQLLHMHNPWEQVGEITKAEVVSRGKRSMWGVTDGGLLVEGFVDSPVDEELGMIPDHPAAKAIHYARMQVRRGRLKLLSIGWRPTKTEMITAKDPRRGGEERRFRLVKSLILGEISLVTMAMSPQSMVEATALRKVYEDAYGPEIADAMFCDNPQDIHNAIPEKVDGLTIPRIRELVAKAAASVAAAERGNIEDERQLPDEGAATPGYKIVGLDERSEPRYTTVSLT